MLNKIKKSSIYKLNDILRVYARARRLINLKNIKPVYICSYPKCGRTWLRFIIGNYLNLKYRLGLNIDFHTMFYLIPNYSLDKNRGLYAYRYLNDKRIPLFIASHSPYRQSIFKGNILFMFRSVYDVLVSKYFHETYQAKSYKDDIKSFIRDNEWGFIPYANYLNSWIPNLNSEHSFILTYEELYNDPYTVMDGVLSFLKIPNDPQLLNKAIKLSTFGKMKEIEIKKGMFGRNLNRQNTEARRVRQGGIGNYIEYLDKEDIEFISKQCQNVFSNETKRIFSLFNIKL